MLTQPRAPRASTGRRAIPRTKKPGRPAAGRRGGPRRPTARKPTARAKAGAAGRRGSTRGTVRARRGGPLAEQPLGVGVGDAFAMERLNVPADIPRKRRHHGVREVGWAEFGELARELVERIGGAFRPDVVLGVINGGVFLGGALAGPLSAEFVPVRMRRDGDGPSAEPVSALAGKSVLVVDDVTVTGSTLAAAVAAAKRAGAGEIRTATLVVRPDRNRPDFHALETNDLVVFGWDYQLHGAGSSTEDPGDVGV